MSVSVDLRSSGGLVLLDAFLCDLHLLFGHSLQGDLPVLVHVNVKLIQEILRLDITPIII